MSKEPILLCVNSESTTEEPLTLPMSSFDFSTKASPTLQPQMTTQNVMSQQYTSPQTSTVSFSTAYTSVKMSSVSMSRTSKSEEVNTKIDITVTEGTCK